MPVVGTMRGKRGGSSWKKKDACGIQGWCLGGSGVTRKIVSRYRCMSNTTLETATHEEFRNLYS